MPKARLGFACLGVLALVLAGCEAKKTAAPPPPQVVVAHPLQKAIVDWDDYVGQFIAVDSVDVRPRVSGYLQTIGFKDEIGRAHV